MEQIYVDKGSKNASKKAFIFEINHECSIQFIFKATPMPLSR